MIYFSKNESERINKVHLLSGIPYNTVKEVFEGLLYSILLDYKEKDPINIPLFGELDITYTGDKLTRKGRVANIKVDFVPNTFFTRTIGQIEDGDESDLEKMFKKKVLSVLKDNL